MLRKRLAAYLGKKSGVPARTAMMLRHAASFEIIVTPTEKEALILEATLIKKYRPRYNIIFRDDKAYPFLRINMREPWPSLGIVRRRRRDGAEYFGPYPSAGALRETVRLVQATFGIRTCTTSTMKNRDRACLQFQMAKCSGPCVKAISQEEYRGRVRQVLDFFSGKRSDVLASLRARMKEAASAMDFERAASLRDQIAALEKVLEKQSVVAGINASWDCVAMATLDSDASVAILRVREGLVSGCDMRRITLEDGDRPEELLRALLVDYYQDGAPPRDILMSRLPAGAEALEEWLSGLWGYGVKISVPGRGDRKRLVEMALANAAKDLESLAVGRRRWNKLSGLLKHRLDLDFSPVTVECVDISHTGGELPVGSLVAFRYGEPWKRGYRTYAFPHIEGIDDYAMIQDLVRRRIEKGLSTDSLPDLLVIDGGPGQLSSAVRGATDGGWNGKRPFICAIAKGRGAGMDRLYIHEREEPLEPERNDPVLLFVQRVRDEAHRFGIRSHRKRRDSKRKVSALSDIPGIGPSRQRLLLRSFGSLARVRQASLRELKAVQGLPASTAEKVYNFIHGKNS